MIDQSTQAQPHGVRSSGGHNSLHCKSLNSPARLGFLPGALASIHLVLPLVHIEVVVHLPPGAWVAKGGEIGDFGTGGQKHYALPWVTERPRCSSGVRGAARSLAHPPQEAGARHYGTQTRHFEQAAVRSLGIPLVSQ
eukprot:scaffold29490_cov63-Phaeocystis_antarctica.AAC.1